MGNEARSEMKKELSDLLLNYLEQIGVEYVFGVPGGAIEPLYDALARSARRGGPHAVVARHETGAAFMAEGYARETGRLGVVCATTGPGTTNLITGVASAYLERVPMLVISAQTALPDFGRGALQESSCTAINTVAMFDDCTVYNSLVSHPDQLEHKLFSAVITATRTPGGPAHLSIPRDVLRIEVDPRTKYDLFGQLPRPRLVDHAAVESLCLTMRNSRRAVIVVGERCGSGIDKLMRFAEHLSAPVIAMPQGKEWVDPYHPLYRGVFGFAGHPSARLTLLDPSVDLILAAGTRLDEFATGGWDREALLNERLVHIHEDPADFVRSPMAQLHVLGDIGAIFERLLARLEAEQAAGRDCRRMALAPPLETLPERRGSPELRCAPTNLVHLNPAAYRRSEGAVEPPYLLCSLVRHLPPETRFLADAGNSFAWTTHYLHPQRAGTYRVAMGFGSMGWAIGAAVGTSFGCHGTPVVCITGDGSMLMSGQELTCAVVHRLPVLFVILNDSALGMVKHGQRLGGAESIAFELPPVDFAAMARAMGAIGFRVDSSETLDGLPWEELGCSGPVVLDVVIDAEAIPPIGTRVRTLAGNRQNDPVEV